MARPLLTFLAILSLIAVTSCGDFGVVDKSKDVVISKAEYEQLKASAALAKQVGRYQLYREGVRTWRLDTATGRSCLLLTSEADWKNPDSLSASCDIEDRNEARERHRQYPSLFDENGNPLPHK
ncbi:MAG: hypothetical protein WB780_12155 [Candidatus Acidiferrales bacterium]